MSQQPFIRSVNTGRMRTTDHSTVGRTAIGKAPSTTPVLVTVPGAGLSGLAGDEIADTRHHGGPDQAVYAYAAEDLEYWAALLGRDLPDGIFGENLTTTGVDLNACVVGETWRIGKELLLQVSDPRIPCRTFGGHLDQAGWVRRFTAEGRSGTYLRVLEPGPVAAGMPMTVVDRPDHGVTVATAFRALTTSPELLPLLLDATGVSERVRAKAIARTERTTAAAR